MATTPTYDEGIARGRLEEYTKGEAIRTRDIFDRDAGHIAGLKIIASGIRLNLARVASCEANGKAARLADELVHALDDLEQYYEAEVIRQTEKLRSY